MAQDEVVKTDLGQMVDSALNWIAVLVVGQGPFYVFAYLTFKAFEISTIVGLMALLLEAIGLISLFNIFFLPKQPGPTPVQSRQVPRVPAPTPGKPSAPVIKRLEPNDDELNLQARAWVKREFGDLRNRRWDIELDNRNNEQTKS